MPGESRAILIVDDETEILRIFSSMLSKKYAVTTAEGVEAAKSMLKKRRYDLVVTDIVMPGVSGVELVKFVQSSYPKTALIVMSGIADSLTTLHELEPLPFISKPFRFREVIEKIEQELKENP